MHEKRVVLIEINSLFIFLMPQFDTFSFLSQLFWVFLSFLLFYLMICFYLLPAIAAILKTRKRKLAQISSSADSGLITQSNFSTITKSSFDTINTKLNAVSASSDHLSVTSSINKSLSVYLSIELSSSYIFNTSILKQSQISYLLFA
jgi:hypothetical protein